MTRNVIGLAGTVVLLGATLGLAGPAAAEGATLPGATTTVVPGGGEDVFTADLLKLPARQWVQNGVVSPLAAIPKTQVITGVREWKLLGRVLMKTTAKATWSFTGGRLVAPKAVSTTASSSIPGITVQKTTASWDWYGPTNGQSRHYTKFLLGVPTPWGGVGSTVEQLTNGRVFGNGKWNFDYT